MFDSQELSRLRKDFFRRMLKYKNKSMAWKWRYYYGNVQYRTLLYYRLFNAYQGKYFKKLFFKLYWNVSLKSGLEINTPILGGGVIIPHWGRIIINASSVGENLYVFHNVTIGSDYITGKPKIGKNVFIGTNTVVVGDISIGDNVVIGAGSFVNKSLPEYVLAAGNPARILKSIDDIYIERLIPGINV